MDLSVEVPRAGKIGRDRLFEQDWETGFQAKEALLHVKSRRRTNSRSGEIAAGVECRFQLGELIAQRELTSHLLKSVVTGIDT